MLDEPSDGAVEVILEDRLDLSAVAHRPGGASRVFQGAVDWMSGLYRRSNITRTGLENVVAVTVSAG